MDQFTRRHIGPREADAASMLGKIGVSTIDELIDKTIPSSIRMKEPLGLPEGISEYEYFNVLKEIASRNKFSKEICTPMVDYVVRKLVNWGEIAQQPPPRVPDTTPYLKLG